MQIESKDLPGLYRSADITSVSAQKEYFLTLCVYLIIILLAAIFAYISSESENEVGYYIGSGALFFCSILILASLKMRKPNDLWYNGRAVAESVKTRTWRWMMKAEPYEESEHQDKPRREFINDLKTILEQNAVLQIKLNLSDANQDAITDQMLKIRQLSLKERLSVYHEQRIQDQLKWYFKKAQHFQRQSNLWFAITICLHIVAMILIGICIKFPNLKLPIEVIAVASSSALTWMESKKFDDLRPSYSLTVQEISFLKSEVNEINTEREFSNYVLNCENAFSREHTQWFARKSK